MEKTLKRELVFEVDWQAPGQGPAEESACFSAFGVRHGEIWLTEAFDWFAKSVTEQVYVSAYPIAEWMAWNWWRLRWEPRTRAADWAMAHSLPSIGGGYVWPNITIVSDGQRVAIIARPTPKRPEEPLRYLADHAAIMPASAFEVSLDQFIGQVCERLRLMDVPGSNLEQLWSDVLAERSDPHVALRRKFEALSGWDPDVADPKLVDRLVADAAALGEEAMGEIAAERPRTGTILTADKLRRVARDKGFSGSSEDMVRLADADKAGLKLQTGKAWKIGEALAKEIRLQESLGNGAISDKTLELLAGVVTGVVHETRSGGALSYVLDDADGPTKIVFRSAQPDSRRFDLARLIGDHLVNVDAALLPATRTKTYRQQLQRSFAAEFLAPFAEVDARLDGDYESYDRRKEVADDFKVSEYMVRVQLANHRKLPWVEPDTASEDDDEEGYFERSVA